MGTKTDTPTPPAPGHTPGDWTAEFDGPDGVWIASHESERVMARLDVDPMIPHEQIIANAALIASAPTLAAENKQLKADAERLRDALQEISLGRGPFKRDELEHADSCIQAMKGEALRALESIGAETDPDKIHVMQEAREALAETGVKL